MISEIGAESANTCRKRPTPRKSSVRVMLTKINRLSHSARLVKACPACPAVNHLNEVSFQSACSGTSSILGGGMGGVIQQVW